MTLHQLRKLCANIPPKPLMMAWEIDWSRRNGKDVWGRNPLSHIASARKWHWVCYQTVRYARIAWKHKNELRGRRIDVRSGYVWLYRCGMTAEDIRLAEEHRLFRGQKRRFVKEHHLVAVKAFGAIPKGHVVRHVNGVKADNRPENLALGTSRENTLDHVTARREVAYWRARALRAEVELERLGAGRVAVLCD